MKILIATNHSYMLYRFRRELIETLNQEHKVVLCMPFVGHEEDFQAMGLSCIPIELDRRSTNPVQDCMLFFRYCRIMDSVKPDVVITYSVKPNIYLGTICRLRRIPYFSNVQGLGTAFERPLLSRIVARMYRVALGGAKAVFFENEENAKFFERLRIAKENRTKVLPGAGINLEAYSYVPLQYDGVCRFLYLGRIMQEKGIDEFFAAAQALKAEFGDHVAFDVVGFYEDAYREKVAQLVEAGVIQFHGFQTDVKPFYQAATCVVMPSWHEGMSNVLLEGAAIGRALITTNIPGCREAVVDGVTGYLCPVKYAEGLQTAMERFLHLDFQQQAEMGRRGHEFVAQHFDKSIVVQDTITYIQEALGLI